MLAVGAIGGDAGGGGVRMGGCDSVGRRAAKRTVTVAAHAAAWRRLAACGGERIGFIAPFRPFTNLWGGCQNQPIKTPHPARSKLRPPHSGSELPQSTVRLAVCRPIGP
jgi:hypothetical protein